MFKLIPPLLVIACLACLHIDLVCRVDYAEYAEPPRTAEIAPQSEETISRGELCLRSLGVFKISHYCPCEKCCGKSGGITATGVKATPRHTIAVDSKVIPYGTQVVIDGWTYTAEDCGGAIKGNRIDIFCDSHEEALNRGVIEREVFIIE